MLSKFQEKMIFNSDSTPAKMSIKYDNGIKIFLDTQELRKFTSQIYFLRKLLEDVLQQNKGVSQEKGKCGIHKTVDLIQERSDRKYQGCQLGRRPDWQSVQIEVGEWQTLGERTPRIQKRKGVCM